MEYLINKSASEKLEDRQKILIKSDNDLVLYWHYKTIKHELREDYFKSINQESTK